MIPLADVKRQFQSVKKDVIRILEQVLDEGNYILGPKVAEFEKKAAEKLGVRHALGVANGTDALVLALTALDIGPGDEVITTPFTFFATAESISRVGARPVFADIDPDTYNLDPKRVKDKVTRATKAVMPVHLFGRPADMDPILELAKEYGLKVIEDACQAFGALYKGKPAGSLGDAACFSFFPTKNLGTAGDGGLVATNDDELAERLRRLRHHGSIRKYFHREIGFNSRLDELHAAMLMVELPYIDAWNARRRKWAARYREELEPLKFIRIAPESPDSVHIYHLFTIECSERDGLMEHLAKRGIQTGIYYPCPLHLQEAYRGLGYKKGDFPVAERLAERILALPMGPFLTDEEIQTITGSVRSFGGSGK